MLVSSFTLQVTLVSSFTLVLKFHATLFRVTPNLVSCANLVNFELVVSCYAAGTTAVFDFEFVGSCYAASCFF